MRSSRCRPAEEIGRGISPEMHEVLLRGLAQSPDDRTLDLDKLASWAAPVDLDVSGSARIAPHSNTARFLLNSRVFLAAAAPGESTNFLASSGV